MPTGNVMEVTLQLRFLLLIVFIFSLCQINQKTPNQTNKNNNNSNRNEVEISPWDPHWTAWNSIILFCSPEALHVNSPPFPPYTYKNKNKTILQIMLEHTCYIQYYSIRSPNICSFGIFRSPRAGDIEGQQSSTASGQVTLKPHHPSVLQFLTPTLSLVPTKVCGSRFCAIFLPMTKVNC